MTSVALAWQEAQGAGVLLGGDPFIYPRIRARELGFACLTGVPSTYTNIEGCRKEDCNGSSREKRESVFSEHLWCAVAPFICKQLSEALRQSGAHKGKQLGSNVSSSAFQLCGLSGSTFLSYFFHWQSGGNYNTHFKGLL